jgi:AcrR family transcriptional regulator
MKELVGNIQITVNEKVFIKDPSSSELGKKIIRSSIELIDHMGMEHFTFRKLAVELGTAESSIYRYFENKHKLLLYLTAWYWGYVEYLLVIAISNLRSPEEQLRKAMEVICDKPEEAEEHMGPIRIDLLYNILISEASKAYLIKEVDNVNKEGLYRPYKRLVNRISDIVRNINPEYPYPNSLVSTIIEGILHQRFFAAHLPSITDTNNSNDLVDFYKNLALNTIKNHQS